MPQVAQQAWAPVWMPGVTQVPTLVDSTAFAATGDKLAFVGRVDMGVNAQSATKNLQFVEFLPGTIVKAGSSGLTCSYQGLSHTAGGPPTEPDGVQGSTVAIAMSALASNTWFKTGNFGAVKAVHHGDEIAIVLEFDGGGRLGADSFKFSCVSASATSALGACGTVVDVATVWTAQSQLANVILGFDDGTYGTIAGGFPVKSLGTQAFNNGSAATEYGVQFTCVAPCTIDGAWIVLQPASNAADFSIVLYKGTTAQQTVAVDANTVNSVAGGRLYIVKFTPTAFAVGDVITVSALPGTVNNVTLQSFDVNTAAHLQAYDLGPGLVAANRAGGAWTTVTTRRFQAGFHFCDFADDTGGGILIHPGMTGGMRG